MAASNYPSHFQNDAGAYGSGEPTTLLSVVPMLLGVLLIAVLLAAFLGHLFGQRDLKERQKKRREEIYKAIRAKVDALPSHTANIAPALFAVFETVERELGKSAFALYGKTYGWKAAADKILNEVSVTPVPPASGTVVSISGTPPPPPAPPQSVNARLNVIATQLGEFWGQPSQAARLSELEEAQKRLLG